MYLEYFMLTSFLCIKFGMTIFLKNTLLHIYSPTIQCKNSKNIQKKPCL